MLKRWWEREEERKKRWGLVRDCEVPFHKGNRGISGQRCSVKRGEVPRSLHSTVPSSLGRVTEPGKGVLNKTPSFSNSSLPAAGPCGSGGHLTPLLRPAWGATAWGCWWDPAAPWAPGSALGPCETAAGHPDPIAGSRSRQRQQDGSPGWAAVPEPWSTMQRGRWNMMLLKPR